MGFQWGLSRRRSTAIALRFIDALNRRDADAAAKLLARDAAFIDAAGNECHGRDACRALLTQVTTRLDRFVHTVEDHTFYAGQVLLRGHIVSSNPMYSGRVIWRAEVVRGKLRLWHAQRPSITPSLVETFSSAPGEGARV